MKNKPMTEAEFAEWCKSHPGYAENLKKNFNEQILMANKLENANPGKPPKRRDNRLHMTFDRPFPTD